MTIVFENELGGHEKYVEFDTRVGTDETKHFVCLKKKQKSALFQFKAFGFCGLRTPSFAFA